MKIAIANNDQSLAEIGDPLAMLPGYALRRAANAMIGDVSARLATINMRLVEASVLMLVDKRSGATASEIGRILDIKRANMVPILARLEAADLIVRKPLDRKSLAIALTAKGTAKLRQVEAIIAEFEADLIARIPIKHRDHFLPALNSLWR